MHFWCTICISNKKGTSKRDARDKEMKTTYEMIAEMKKLNVINEKERVIDCYTEDDELIEGQFITVITAEEFHVYFKTTYFYNYVTKDYKFIRVNGCM